MHQSRSVNAHQRQVLRQRASHMRHSSTPSEWLLWQALQGQRLGVVFRRQVVLRGYIVDFYACAAGLVVEVDGAWHVARVAADGQRDRVLRAVGYRVLRVSAEQVVSSLPSVVERIRTALAQL